LSLDGRVAYGRVRDSGRSPCEVEVLAAGGLLASRCTCPYEAGPACPHAVAVVEALRFPRPAVLRSPAAKRLLKRSARRRRGQGRVVSRPPVPAGTLFASPGDWALTQDERVAIAREEELAGRRARARKERAPIRRLPMRGGPPRFEVRGHEPGAPYLVTLRGPGARLPSCTCPDFSKNELGTCKHSERVRAWFGRQPKRLPRKLISLWWCPRVWLDRVPVALLELRLTPAEGALPDSLSSWFDEEGWLRPPPPGEDLLGWAQRALAAARDEADRAGLHFDLDPAVAERLREEAERRRVAERLGAIEPGGSIWQEVVPRLGLKLHPFQEEGTLFLARCGRAFLADDMGLGKTLQAIAAALLLRRAAGASRALVVCPASLKHQWEREILRACGEKAVVMDGGRQARLAVYRGWREGFLILNYELALRDLEAIQEAAPELVILDEAQRIKNWETKTAQAIKTLRSGFAFVLTGTPLENRLTELHSLVEFLHPRALGPRWRLIPYHAVTDPEGRVLAYEDLELLRSRLSGFFLRRQREEVLDQLPPRIENTYWTEMTANQWRAYRALARRVAAIAGRGRPLSAGEVQALLQMLTAMRIVSNAWAQYAWERFGERVLDGRAPTEGDLRALGSPKLEEFREVLDDLLEDPTRKIVVYSQWERLLRLAQWAVRDRLDRRGERADIFHGGLDARQRLRMLEAFRSESDFRVLFSTDAGGLGLNLQEAASVVVNLEVPWNPAVLEQRIGRVHRMGQRRSVHVLHFVARGTIEERISKIVASKRALFEGLFVEGADQIVLDDSGQAPFLERVRELVEEDAVATVPPRSG
jgi:superfamily II DNA or RNA helicase